MSNLILITIIFVALYFGYRMDRLERQLEDVFTDSLRKILTLPLNIRQAELKTHLEDKKEDVARRRRGQRILGLLLLGVLIILGLAFQFEP